MPTPPSVRIMQRYFPASRFVVFTTLNEAMNRRELVTFISFRGASRTSMPCINGGREGKKKQYQLSYRSSKIPDDTASMLIPCRSWFHRLLPWAVVPAEQLVRKLKFCCINNFKIEGCKIKCAALSCFCPLKILIMLN